MTGARRRRAALAALVGGVACGDSGGGTPAPGPPASVRAHVTCEDGTNNVRTCTYTTQGSSVRAVDSLFRLTRVLVWQDGAWRLLPRFYGTAMHWGLCHLAADTADAPRPDAVTVADFDGDGRRDVLVVGACATGMGPEGARDFPVASLYRQVAPGQYRADEARDSAITDGLWEACGREACDSPGVARRLVRGLGTP